MSKFVQIFPSSKIETFINSDLLERVTFRADGSAGIWFQGDSEPIVIDDRDSVGRLKLVVGGVIIPEIRESI